MVGNENKSVSLFLQCQLRRELHFEATTFGYLTKEEIVRSVWLGYFKGKAPLGGSHHRQSAALSSWHSQLRWWLYRCTPHSPRFPVTPHTDSHRPLQKTWRCQLKSALLSISITKHKCFCIFFKGNIKE